MKTFVLHLVCFAALLLCAVSLVQSSWRAGILVQGKLERKGSDSLSPEQLARTKSIFNERCAKCHGADGRGDTIIGKMAHAPDFTDEKWWKEKDDKRFINSVTNGKDDMPAFGKKLSKHEISALVAYVRRFNKTPR